MTLLLELSTINRVKCSVGGGRWTQATSAPAIQAQAVHDASRITAMLSPCPVGGQASIGPDVRPNAVDPSAATTRSAGPMRWPNRPTDEPLRQRIGIRPEGCSRRATCRVRESRVWSADPRPQRRAGNARSAGRSLAGSLPSRRRRLVHSRGRANRDLA